MAAPTNPKAMHLPRVIRGPTRGRRFDSMKSQDSVEALYALIFAVCVLLALFLLVG